MKELNKKSFAIIGTVGVPARYGGFETLAHQLVDHLDDRYDMTVYCSGKFYPRKERLKCWKEARLVYLPLSANGLSSILYDLISIIHALFTSQVLLILGVSAGIFLPFIKKLTNKPIIINIDGLEWRRAKWNKWAKRYLRYAEQMAVSAADVVIADNPAIADYVLEAYGKEAFMIPYGGDHVFPVVPTDADKAMYPFMVTAYAFKVCRIEPENNIEMILKAFAHFDGFPLVVVGNWEHSAYGQRLWAEYKDHPQLVLLKPIYDERTINLLRSNCHLYVHGHSAGGTNPSLVEAMNLGLPILAKDVIYNRLSTDHEAFLFNDEADLLTHLQQLTPWHLERKGMQMKNIALKKYQWKDIAAAYAVSLEANGMKEPETSVPQQGSKVKSLIPN